MLHRVFTPLILLACSLTSSPAMAKDDSTGNVSLIFVGDIMIAHDEDRQVEEQLSAAALAARKPRCQVEWKWCQETSYAWPLHPLNLRRGEISGATQRDARPSSREMRRAYLRQIQRGSKREIH